jgi:hypothetical protein
MTISKHLGPRELACVKLTDYILNISARNLKGYLTVYFIKSLQGNLINVSYNYFHSVSILT